MYEHMFVSDTVPYEPSYLGGPAMTPTRLDNPTQHRVASQPSSWLGGAPAGVSTGYMDDARLDWPALVGRAGQISEDVVEISALSGHELPSLVNWMRHIDRPPFAYVAVHGPTKDVLVEPAGLASQLSGLPAWVTSIVLHPDTLGEPLAFRSLGSRLVLENMDFRKLSGRSAIEMVALFNLLPEAGFCLDVAHARSIDPAMRTAHELLDQFRNRLRQIHISGLDKDGHHIPITEGDLDTYAPVLQRCADIPVVFEAPPPEWLSLSRH